MLIYSLLNDIKIKNYFGITGETHFGLFLTEIGGLQEKIIYSINLTFISIYFSPKIFSATLAQKKISFIYLFKFRQRKIFLVDDENFPISTRNLNRIRG